jgi:hypothetical protein
VFFLSIRAANATRADALITAWGRPADQHSNSLEVRIHLMALVISWMMNVSALTRSTIEESHERGVDWWNGA